MERFPQGSQYEENLSMSYTVIIENKAQKEFLKLSPPQDNSVRKAIDGLEIQPRPHGVKKLSGTTNGHRVRAGNYRILYTIDDRERIVTVYRIRHRREAYR
jgi:mRNA interferase RelE/StbE